MTAKIAVAKKTETKEVIDRMEEKERERGRVGDFSVVEIQRQKNGRQTCFYCITVYPLFF